MAVLGAQCMPTGPQRAAPLGGGLGSKLCSCCPSPGEAKRKQNRFRPSLILPSRNPQVERVTPFLSKTGRLKETTRYKLPSLL